METEFSPDNFLLIFQEFQFLSIQSQFQLGYPPNKESQKRIQQDLNPIFQSFFYSLEIPIVPQIFLVLVSRMSDQIGDGPSET